MLRHFIRFSHVGRRPILIENGVVVSVEDSFVKRATNKMTDFVKYVRVKGPLGEMGLHLPPCIEIQQVPSEQKGETILRTILDEAELQKLTKNRRTFVKQMYGLTNSLLRNIAVGVSEGHLTYLRVVGVGFKVTLQDNILELRVGYCHPIYARVPEGITATVPAPNKIILSGIDLQKLNLFAAKIRKIRKPEPYKGKGIFVNEETIIRKSSKKK